jgi:2-methylisocitrate lyase-like PEP mutase family enzyme
MNREQQVRAEIFHQLHAGPAPLMLPNAWDVASARVIENAGAGAIATTSAGMAWSLGYADGERLPVQELLAACQRICRVVAAPVSVDIERGYGRDAEDTGGLIGALLQLGVVGVNIEDGCLPGTQTLAKPAVLCERIACARAVARHQDVRLFINARIDTYLSRDLPAAAKWEETRTRALAYVDAGADGIFVPGLAEPEDIARLARALPVPLNVYAGYAGAPEAQQLQALGVRRISLGCGPLQALLAQLAEMATEAIQAGRYDAMGKTMLTPAQVNGLFAASDKAAAHVVPYVGMGDGPVAQLLALPQRGRETALTTRNGATLLAVDPVTQPAWRRLFASMLGEHRGVR